MLAELFPVEEAAGGHHRRAALRDRRGFAAGASGTCRRGSEHGSRVADGDERALRVVQRDVVAEHRGGVLPERRVSGERRDVTRVVERHAVRLAERRLRRVPDRASPGIVSSLARRQSRANGALGAEPLALLIDLDTRGRDPRALALDGRGLSRRCPSGSRRPRSATCTARSARAGPSLARHANRARTAPATPHLARPASAPSSPCSASAHAAVRLDAHGARGFRRPRAAALECRPRSIDARSFRAGSSTAAGSP